MGKVSLLRGFGIKLKEKIKKQWERHLVRFWPVWAVLFLFLLGTFVYWLAGQWGTNDLWFVPKWLICTGIVLIIFLFGKKPMNVVYGMMGTSGSIRVFFVNFLIISLAFSAIYHWGFFQNAMLTYDVNQPHVYFDYDGEVNKERIDTIITLTTLDAGQMKRDTVYQVQNFHYQKITYGQTLRNTIMTTLMQEPTDFFSVAATYNDAMKRGPGCLDAEKAALFHWLLIIQILISWIFFGVFISILYNKFRYES